MLSVVSFFILDPLDLVIDTRLVHYRRMPPCRRETGKSAHEIDFTIVRHHLPRRCIKELLYSDFKPITLVGTDQVIVATPSPVVTHM
jgi:hypothetical protein